MDITITLTISVPEGASVEVKSDVAGPEKVEAVAPAEEKPARSRRQRSKTKADPAPESEEAKAEEEKPARRRGRPRKEEAKAEEKAEEKPARRRGRPRKDEARKDDGGISDADLVNACSAAAEITGPDVVTEILEKDFEVDNVKDLKAADRQEFLDELDREVAAWKEEAEASDDD